MSRSTFNAKAVALTIFFVLASAVPGGSQEKASILGFRGTGAETERQLEQRLQSIPDAMRAESNLRHLTREPHMAGTEASHRTAIWLRDQYRSFGFDADIVTYNVWLPLPVEVKLELTAPQRKALNSQEQVFDQDPDTSDKRVVVGFNSYSPSGDVVAPVVYVNYGMQQDYRRLEALGVGVEGKIVVARYGQGFRGIKAKLAEEHKAAGLIIYSDPGDDGYMAGDTFPNGPWRPMSGIQRGSILYTQIYPGDPLAQGSAAFPGASDRQLAPKDAATISHIPTMPINAKDAAILLSSLGGKHVPRGWQGGLPFTYHVGPGDARAHLKIVMDYQQRPIYDVIAKLHGADDNSWVILGNHHDAWVFGAADPGSGTASMLEAARALGELVRSGWTPRRRIVMCEWDAEEPGLIGSTEWVMANRAELQEKAVAYINTDVGVTGPNFSAASTPSLKAVLRDATRQVQDPANKTSVYDSWRGNIVRAGDEEPGPARRSLRGDGSGEAPIGALGAGSDFSPFLDYAGIPSADIGFGGDYGVYHSLYDDFYWMKHFGDPTFIYHAALARVLGTVALRLAEADVLPFDYSQYASEIARAEDDLAERTSQKPMEAEALKPIANASTELTASAERASSSLRILGSSSLPPEKTDELNRALATVEQSFLAPQGLSGRPWFKHTIFAPGSYAGYAAEVMPGVNEAIDRDDVSTLRVEANSVAAALRELRRAWTKLPDWRRLRPLLPRPAIEPAAATGRYWLKFRKNESLGVNVSDPIRRVCVYCASSERVDKAYLDAARKLGEVLARNSVTVVYGGGAIGLMGRLADGVLANGGHVIGVIPRFMQELEWDHRGLTELQVVENMRERKHIMLTDSDAAIALPGGSGTLEELLEAITLKRLGIYLQPIVLVNILGFFDPLLALFDRCIREHFMDERHAAMWQVADRPEDVMTAIQSQAPWTSRAREFATLRPDKRPT